jgi:hypothetical protein
MQKAQPACGRTDGRGHPWGLRLNGELLARMRQFALGRGKIEVGRHDRG